MIEDKVEVWKAWPKNEKIRVSSFGRVRSARGHCYKSSHSRGGYRKVNVSIDGKRVTRNVHRLVAETFLPNPNNLPEVNHKNCDRTDNCADNLEWCTHSYNQKYREKFGVALYRPVFAINLNTLEVSWFPSQIEASRELGIYRQRVDNIVKGLIKKDKDFWIVREDDNTVNITRHKLNEIGRTELWAKQGADIKITNKLVNFVIQCSLQRAWGA